MRRAQPSTTARKVCLNIIALGAKPGMEQVLPVGIVDATERLLLAAGVVGKKAVRFASTRLAVALYEAFDWMIPGQFVAFAHRKALCEEQVREGIAAGATQILVLGAGYDTLGWRLAPEHPEVGFFEIDHPATARRKAVGIDRLGARANLHLIPADLGTRRLVDVLAADPSWDPNATSVVIAEGLLQYLQPAAVNDLLVQCCDSVGVGSRIGFTHVGTGDDGRPDVGRWTGLVMWLLAAGGEPWLSSIRPQELPQLLERTGWRHEPELTGGVCRHGMEYFAVAVK